MLMEGHEMAIRRKFSDRFKAKVAIEALRGDRPTCMFFLRRLSARHGSAQG